MAGNYLLSHIRRDAMASLLFCLLFGGLGAFAQWGLPGPENASLRFAGMAALAVSGLGLFIAGGPVLNPAGHQSVLDLRRYGPLDKVLAELQQDGASAVRYGRLRLGSRWLTACGIGITAVRRDEIAAVELAQTELHSSGVKVGSNWRLTVTTRDGRSLDFNCRDRDTGLFVQTQLS